MNNVFDIVYNDWVGDAPGYDLERRPQHERLVVEFGSLHDTDRVGRDAVSEDVSHQQSVLDDWALAPASVWSNESQEAHERTFDHRQDYYACKHTGISVQPFQ